MRPISVIMVAALFLLLSCSSERSALKAFEKKGYVVQQLTPQRQAEVAPLPGDFPRYDADACGYMPSRNGVTFLYALDEAAWSAYCMMLAAEGFDCFGTGFVKADYGKGVTYNVSGRVVELYGRRYLLVAYASVAL